MPRQESASGKGRQRWTRDGCRGAELFVAFALQLTECLLKQRARVRASRVRPRRLDERLHQHSKIEENQVELLALAPSFFRCVLAQSNSQVV
eukprot:4007344-Pyramimonas_sp.AAC.1